MRRRRRRPSHRARRTPAAMAADIRFRGMGSDVHVIVVGPPRLVGLARRRLADLERRWSRFLPDSEVSRLNEAGGRLVTVSDETRLLVERALTGWRITGGLFDPTVLGDVVRAGYDRSFDRLGPLAAAGSSTWERGACGVVVTDDGHVRLPPGVAFDPGGVGKGLAADLVAGELVAAGAAGACVNVGGDIRVRGVAPGGGAWRVDIEDPAGTGAIGRVAIDD